MDGVGGAGVASLRGPASRRAARPAVGLSAGAGPAPAPAGRRRPPGHRTDLFDMRPFRSTAGVPHPGRSVLQLVQAQNSGADLRSVRAGGSRRHPPPGRTDLPAMLCERREPVRRLCRVRASPPTDQATRRRCRLVRILCSRTDPPLHPMWWPPPGGGDHRRRPGLLQLLPASATPLRSLRAHTPDPDPSDRRPAGPVRPVLPPDRTVRGLRSGPAGQRPRRPWRSFPLHRLPTPPIRPVRRLRPDRPVVWRLAPRLGLLPLRPPPPAQPSPVPAMRRRASLGRPQRHRRGHLRTVRGLHSGLRLPRVRPTPAGCTPTDAAPAASSPTAYTTCSATRTMLWRNNFSRWRRP